MDAQSPERNEPSLLGSTFLIRGVVQGVGFRPFVYRLASRLGLVGTVRNDGRGVSIIVEGGRPAIETFARCLRIEAPEASQIVEITQTESIPRGLPDFRIDHSDASESSRPTVRISPDLATCAACLEEMRDPGDRRAGYPYLVCTECGPRYSIVRSLPYDRSRTTLRDWPLCPTCRREFEDPTNRHFHAQPTACPSCGPHYRWECEQTTIRGDVNAIGEAVKALRSGKIVAIKGVGGYHLACDANDPDAVESLRVRKYRKEKPFALLVRDEETARTLIELSSEAGDLLRSPARPIQLGVARKSLPSVAPGHGDLGVMLPSTPLHTLLFDGGAPDVLVMTSGNRSSEPIAIDDNEARRRLSGIADGYLIGERPIARRVEDSIVRVGALGPVVLRRARGLAPGVAATIPTDRPILGLGSDLKAAITLVVEGQAIVGPHLGDLEHAEAVDAFHEAIDDLLAIYGLDRSDLLVVHDLHPGYRSTAEALAMQSAATLGVQHHRAHVASVLAERGDFHRRVLGLCCDGTGFGDDGASWGGELFVGSVAEGLERVLHLRTSPLPGGDAAARWPVMAAAGFLSGVDGLPDLSCPPFRFDHRYRHARHLIERNLRTFTTSSLGRLFDAIASLVGFTCENTFEGQAATWLEHLARSPGDTPVDPYPFPIRSGALDFRPMLLAIVQDRAGGRDEALIARAAHLGIATGLGLALSDGRDRYGINIAVLSGGVFQNDLLLGALREAAPPGMELWTNQIVPPNDGGISLGQVALGAFSGNEVGSAHA